VSLAAHPPLRAILLLDDAVSLYAFARRDETDPHIATATRRFCGSVAGGAPSVIGDAVVTFRVCISDRECPSRCGYLTVRDG
jgi:hypothetical protein